MSDEKKGEEIEIKRSPDRPFLHRNQDVGHITGTDPEDPPEESNVSFWPRW